MTKRLIRLTESDLHRIVKESVNRILRENEEDYGIPPYIVTIGDEVEGAPFDDIYEAIEFAEARNDTLTAGGERMDVIIYDGNDEEVWSLLHVG